MENEETIIGLLGDILAELKTLNAHAAGSRVDVEKVRQQQVEQAEKLMGTLRNHIPPAMAEAIFGGQKNG